MTQSVSSLDSGSPEQPEVPPQAYEIDQRDLPGTPGKRRFTIEKIMLALSVAFALGVVIMTWAPEPLRGLGPAVVSCLILWALYRIN